MDLVLQSGFLFDRYPIGVIDAVALGIPREEVIKHVLDNGYNVVLSLTADASRTIDLEFLGILKQETGARIALSGGYVLYEWRDLFNDFSCIDAVLLNYGTDDFLRYLNSPKGETVDNIVYRENGTLKIGPVTQRKDHFHLPLPRHELFPLKRYFYPYGTRKPCASIITTLGCPFNCAFCTNRREGAIRFERRDVANVMEEIRYISSLGIQEVNFRDFTFNAVPEDTRELCRMLIRERLPLVWQCQSRVDCVSREDLLLWKKAGCYLIGFGIESGDEGLLSAYNKGTSLAKIRETFRNCHQLGIRSFGFFILGLPGDNEETILKTIDFAKELPIDYVSFSIAMPFLGTKLRENAIDRGLIDPRIRDLNNGEGFPLMDLTGLSTTHLDRLRQRAYSEFYFRPSIILRRLFMARSLSEIWGLFREGFSLLLKMSARLFTPHNSSSKSKVKMLTFSRAMKP